MESRVGAGSVRLAVYWPCAIFGLAILNGSDDLIGKRSEEEPSGVWRKVGPQRQAEYEVKRDAGCDCNSGRIHFPCPYSCALMSVCRTISGWNLGRENGSLKP